MTTMTAPVIDLDPPDTSTPTRPAEAQPFTSWLDTWSHRHPAKFGIAAGTLAVAAVAFTLLAANGIRTAQEPQALAAPRAVSTHVFQIAIDGADEQATTVVRRDSMSRGEMLGADPLTMDDVAAISVSARGTSATCRITVDGKVVDQAAASANGLVTCLWVAGR